MLGNPELERALLEQTYVGVMTVTGVSKQTVEFKGKKVDIKNSGVGTIHITMESTS